MIDRSAISRIASLPPRAFVMGWRLLISPLYGPVCRYHPSCSAYALKALETHGALAGSWLALKRLARCHPWGGQGHDPVPPAAPRGSDPMIRKAPR